ncbi:hypothetical protein [Clostridium tagluense]|uniref:hypothetical protein n=1 Tax=Clostridium tagluense TaxID=360422 RepID=UPI001C0D69F5|nr:hypothetical protein [Clostridium tagluense]MBU3130561.1 hypothetical protein [Clostridium tagluense]
MNDKKKYQFPIPYADAWSGGRKIRRKLQMTIDLNAFQKSLAQHKVYDAWQYVESLRETLTYMNISCELLEKVYEHRIEALSTQEQKIMETAVKTGKASIRQEDLSCTNLDIVGLVIDDSMFLRKNTMEFFHYARMSMDILFQIINAALFGDKSSEVTDRRLISNVLGTLSNTHAFADLKTLLDNNKNDDKFKYLQAFDNYIKHIKTILVIVKNSFMLGNTNEFFIREFVYNGTSYPTVKALNKVKETNDYVINTVKDILLEVQKQLLNCLDNSKRIQTISFKQLIKENPKSNIVEYISFFIDVQNDISELPQEIKVLPLIIKPNDEIYSFDFRFHKIFIKKKGCEEESIIGCAELKNGLETNELYRRFDVRTCDIKEYHEYVFSFAQNYPKISINYYAMEGSIMMCKD